MQLTLPLKLNNHCIMDKMIIPDDTDWIFEIIDRCDEKYKQECKNRTLNIKYQ